MTKTKKGGILSALKWGTSATAVVVAMTSLSSVALAQDQDMSDEEQLEEIVVTGSRIRRDEFSSAAPMQTMNVEAARQVGISSLTDMLQRSSIANGQQINADLNTNAGNSNASEPPPLGGVGSANIALRGLDPSRTLVLTNGRRLGASGVRGAPSQPDLNLLPLALVERVEVITEGASSVYGADAVAGVVNVILRDSFEGMEVSASTKQPGGGGKEYQLSFITGTETDRSSFVLAADFYERQRLSVGDRRDCVESLAIDSTTGERLPTFCSLGFFDNIVWSGGSPQPDGHASSWYFFTGEATTDTGIPNFSSALSFDEPSGNGQDCRRADERCRALGPIGYYGGQADRLQGDLIQPSTRFSAVAMAKYSPDWWDANEEFYFETYYLNRHAYVKGATEQIFPTILNEIPQADADGNIIRDANGDPILVDNPLNPFPEVAIPIITIDSLKQNRDVELQHFRFVGGFRGDLPSSPDWSYDMFVSYDRGAGAVEKPQMNEQSLILATQTLVQQADGSVTCGTNITDFFGFITQQQCVPVNFFAPSIYGGSVETTGDFATDAERDFLIGSRVNRTVVEQFMAGMYVTGDLMELPAGEVGVAVGGEFRRDAISSFADFISAKSLNAGENPGAEGATKGSRDIYDLYAEVNVPLIANDSIDYMGIEGAARYTDEELFGSKVTTRMRFTLRPNDWMQLSGSYGTSFRAPNLRETFLAAQIQGTSSANDPCGVPGSANNGGVYDPTGETRSSNVLQNCAIDGVDPTVLGIVANVNLPVIVSGNATDLKPETSRSYTATFQVSPKLSDRFDLDLAVSYFDIEIEDSIRSVDAATIMARCYNGPVGLTSPFCSRIERDLVGNPQFDFITSVDASFVNVGLETSKGFDFNARFRTTLDMGEYQDVNVGWSGALTLQTGRKERIFNEDPFEDLLGDFGMPKRRISSTFSVAHDRWEFLWDTRHISGGQAKDVVYLAGACTTPIDATHRVGPNQVLSVCDAPGAWYHNASFTYRMDQVVITAGVSNVFDKEPPLVSIGAGSNRANRLTSSGYDQLGRSFFLNLTAAF